MAFSLTQVREDDQMFLDGCPPPHRPLKRQLLVGLVLMQLALGKVRSGSGLKAFNTALEAVDYDLSAWRRRANLSSKDTAILDADDSAGWELAEALLRPRSIEVDEESGAVKFVNTNHEAVRLSVSLALTHKFIKQVHGSYLIVAGTHDHILLGAACVHLSTCLPMTSHAKSSTATSPSN